MSSRDERQSTAREEAVLEATGHFFEAVFSGSSQAAAAYFSTSVPATATVKVAKGLHEDAGAEIIALEATELDDGSVRVTAVVEWSSGEETDEKLEWEHQGRSPDDWAEWFIVVWE